MKEIQSQLKLQIDILNSVANFEAIADFQRQVIEIIGEMDLKMRKQFVARLKEEKPIMAAVKF